MPKLSRSLLIDSLGATLTVFLVCWLLKIIVFNAEFTDPVHGALHNVEEEFSNLVYDNVRAPTGTAASTICLVDIGEANRTEMASILEAIASQKPQLVAVDIIFDKKNTSTDTSLYRTLRKLRQQNKLVMASWVSFEGERRHELTRVHQSDALYAIEPTGYTNFVAEEVNGVVRHHLPQLGVRLGKETAPSADTLSFAARIVSMVAPKTWQDYGRHQAAMGRYEPDWVLYQKDQNLFQRFSASDLTRGSASPAELTDKIVLVGSMNDVSNQYIAEDVHLVPLGENAHMTGMEIHANIIAMLLDRTHLRKIDDWIVWLLAFPVCWVLLIFLVWKSKQETIWAEFLGKIVQVGTGFVIVGIALMLFQFQHVELRTLPILIPVALTADVLLFYGSLMQWLSSKGYLPYNSYFKHAHSKKAVSTGRASVPAPAARSRR